tara:strand:- start:179 stop:433 length:255 start_codon:yes stop_codon:yes gene_type:complete
MPNKKVLVTSKGCYAVNESGVTIELEVGVETLVEDVQAAVFVKVGKATLITNKKKTAKKADETDLDGQEDHQDESLEEPEVKAV